MAMSHTWNGDLGNPSLARRARSLHSPIAVAASKTCQKKKETLIDFHSRYCEARRTKLGYDARSRTKLKASRAGSADITEMVSTYLSATGPRGVPKGRVEAKKVG